MGVTHKLSMLEVACEEVAAACAARAVGLVKVVRIIVFGSLERASGGDTDASCGKRPAQSQCNTAA